MGNQGSQLGDEPSSDMASSHSRSLQHFDHNFKGELHTTRGPLFESVFGECAFAKRPVQLICKGHSFEILEEIGLTQKKQIDVQYGQVTSLAWDHFQSEVKIDVKADMEGEHFVILSLANSIELEGEFKLRFQGAAGSVRLPATSYVGMFAGAVKPKPFQRKRPNISKLPNGKLPPLTEMRNNALHLQRGSYKPCPPGESRRIDLAVQHIYEGFNTFPVLRVRGPSSISNQWRSESILQMKDEGLYFKPSGPHNPNTVSFEFEDIVDWDVEDNDHIRAGDSGIELTSASGEKILFYVPHIRDAKHTLEFYWNRYCVENGRPCKLGSTHGRPLVTMATLSGELPAHESPVGQCEVVDQDGILVRPGGKMAKRASMIGDMIGGSAEPKVVPPENRDVKKHWHKVVMHQGWLLKKGGVGVGQIKSWIKRYFVLYKTSQGHFLFYYSDFTECPLFSTERSFRNVVDLAKTTFIRPGSNKAEESDTPPHSFDIVTTEREWTLCAESQENVQKWLKLITRGVDEDVAILPDEELLFKVKPKVDPLGVLNPTDYSTSLRVSANGVSVCVPDQAQTKSSYTNAVKEQLGVAPEREVYFWVYTDFYKWSLLTQAGKLALLVNVFADSSFSRRNEYVFRNKEAQRLSTAIEYFIEKFMSVMHIRLETTEGAFDGIDEESNTSPSKGGLHNVGNEEWGDDEQGGGGDVAMDLLGLDISSPSKSHSSADPFGSGAYEEEESHSASKSAPSAPPAPADPFGDDPFGARAPVPATTAQRQQTKPPSGAVDLFGDDPFGGPAAPAPAPAAVPSHHAVAKSVDPFGDDPFAARPPASAPAPASVPVSAAKSADPFGGDDLLSVPAVGAPAPKAHSNPLDLFDSSFGAPAPAPVAAPVGPKTAPPLTQAQQAMHAQWLLGALMKGGGPLYDDGTLQIATQIEIRGSQGRLTFFLRNCSPATLSEMKITIQDSAGLLRFQAAELPSTLGGLAQASLQVMVECMKPVSPGPSVVVNYVDALLGKRSNTLPLPLLLTSFNEPLNILGPDFTQRWEALSAPGLQQQEIFSPTQRISPQNVFICLTSGLKFGRVTGLPDESEYVLYGAASLRTGSLNPQGEKISVGCLVKLEMNVQSNAVRVTVRTLHPQATIAVMATAKSILV